MFDSLWIRWNSSVDVQRRQRADWPTTAAALCLASVVSACASSEPVNSGTDAPGRPIGGLTDAGGGGRGDRPAPADAGPLADAAARPDDADDRSDDRSDDARAGADAAPNDAAVDDPDTMSTPDAPVLDGDGDRDADACIEGVSCDPDDEEPAGSCCSDPVGCADRCEPSALRLGGSCTGCTTLDAAGVCEGGETLPCTAETGTVCQEATCGGASWWCTEIAGQWAWRVGPACNDGNPCSRNDRCSEGTCAGVSYSCPPRSCPASRCDGTTFIESGGTCTPSCDGEGGCSTCACDERPKPCGTGAGNECCASACDAVLGCTTVAGSCGGNDVCSDPTVLQIAAACTGCGAEAAVGICSGGRSEVCDAATGGLCRQVACGGLTYTCSNVAGTWRWTMATACDDGNPCTHSDTCSSGVCAGTSVACVSDPCNERSCNGTATCTTAPRTGLACDDGNACTAATTCSAAGVCGGGVGAATCGDGVCNCGETNASCPADCPILLPANACTNGAGSRDRCSNARIISRAAAATTWTSGNQNTCSGNNRFDGECGGIFDVGNDHVYTLYVRAGERVTATATTLSTRCQSGDDFRARLKIRFNPDATAAGATACPTFEGCYSVSPTTREYTRVWDAPADGWVFLILDGGASAWNEHRGHYTLSATLTRCESPGCGC